MHDHTEARCRHLEEFRALVAASKRLKQVFTADWFAETKELILKARGEPGLQLRTHTAFVGYLHDAILEPERHNLLQEVDEALDHIGDTARRTLTDKLRMVSRGTDDYVSAVFEALVVNKFAVRGLLVDYEPPITSGRPDARVRLAEQRAFVEARATLDAAFQRPNGAFDPKELGLKLAGKVAEKYTGQLSAATIPVVLFIALNANLHFEDAEIEVAFEQVAADAAAAVLSAIVLSDDFRARRFQTWIHPAAARPLTKEALSELTNAIDA